MTDVLPVEAPLADLRDLEVRLRDTYDALPHEFKVEIVDGELHFMAPSGERPGTAAANILVSLKLYQRAGATGRAYGDNVGFRVNLPGRGSFSPDAAFYTGASRGIGFIHDAPDFAVEVRSEGDYGRRAEGRMARKRDDYFAAGTKVVWDVDTLGDDVVRVYCADRPETPDVLRRGETADAEPAVSGWPFAVNELFD